MKLSVHKVFFVLLHLGMTGFRTYCSLDQCPGLSLCWNTVSHLQCWAWHVKCRCRCGMVQNGVEGLVSRCPMVQWCSTDIKVCQSTLNHRHLIEFSAALVDLCSSWWFHRSGGVFLRWHQRPASSARGLPFARSFGKGSREFYLAILLFHHILLRFWAPFQGWVVVCMCCSCIKGQHVLCV